MDKSELLKLLEDFLNEKGLYNSFLSFAEEKGYSEDELDKVFSTE